jgi:hypothetical protein
MVGHVLPPHQLGPVPGVGGERAQLGHHPQPGVTVGARPARRGLVVLELALDGEPSDRVVGLGDGEQLQRPPFEEGRGVRQGRIVAAHPVHHAVPDAQQPLAAGDPAGEKSTDGLVERRVVVVDPAQVVGAACIGDLGHEAL